MVDPLRPTLVCLAQWFSRRRPSRPPAAPAAPPTPAGAGRRRAGLDRLPGLALAFARPERSATAGELARHLAELARDATPSGADDRALAERTATRTATDTLEEAFARLREEVLE